MLTIIMKGTFNMNSIAEKIKWLFELGKRMKEQDTDCQAAPRFWVVREKKKYFGFEEGFEDGIVLELGSERYDVSEQKEFFETMASQGSEIAAKYRDKIEETGNLFDEDELRNIVEEINDDYFDCGVVGYCEYNKIAENTMFITKAECKKHIAENDYHYYKPHTYAMTAWRSPEVEKLFSILEDEKLWNKVLNILDEENKIQTNENKHGRWIRPEHATPRGYKWKCSECGKEVNYVPGGSRKNKEEAKCGLPYCPYCKASMDGDENE